MLEEWSKDPDGATAANHLLAGLSFLRKEESGTKACDANTDTAILERLLIPQGTVSGLL